jgi:ligand-binding sensor domain-containing protein
VITQAIVTQVIAENYMPPLLNRFYALATLALFSSVVAAQDREVANPESKPAAKGTVVTELGKSVMYVFQTKNGDYWFGSNDRGVYRYDGKSLINFTTKDGLVSDRIRGVQGDKTGNVYFTTYEGISKFDGKAFITLTAPKKADPKGWKLQTDDLWFVGPPDAGVVFRYDGESLHQLEFPRTKLGDEHYEKMPRSKFPNAIYSPYDVYCILRDSKGHIWFGSSSVGVCRYDGSSFDWLTDPLLTEAPVRSILEDRKGNFWFTYTGHGKLDGPKVVGNFDRLKKGVDATIVEGLSVVEGDGKFWTAALRDGVYQYDGNKKTAHPIRDGRTAVEVFAIYKDNRDVLWLGTHNGGAYRFNGKAFEKWKP